MYEKHHGFNLALQIHSEHLVLFHSFNVESHHGKSWTLTNLLPIQKTCFFHVYKSLKFHAKLKPSASLIIWSNCHTMVHIIAFFVDGCYWWCCFDTLMEKKKVLVSIQIYNPRTRAMHPPKKMSISLRFNFFHSYAQTLVKL